jgi:hypothetical protein
MAGADLTEQQRNDIEKLLGSPLEYPQAFKDWVPQFLAQTIPYLPLSQISGVGTLKPWYDVIIGPEVSGVEKNTWGDLTFTPGPRVDEVSGGEYLAIWGYDYEAGNAGSWLAGGVCIDGNDPVGNAFIDGNSGTDEGYFNWKAARITVPSDGELHFVKLKYMFDDGGSGGDCTVNYRWLILLRVK